MSKREDFLWKSENRLHNLLDLHYKIDKIEQYSYYFSHSPLQPYSHLCIWYIYLPWYIHYIYHHILRNLTTQLLQNIRLSIHNLVLTEIFRHQLYILCNWEFKIWNFYILCTQCYLNTHYISHYIFHSLTTQPLRRMKVNSHNLVISQLFLSHYYRQSYIRLIYHTKRT